MTYSELAHRIISTIYQTKDALSGEDLDEIAPELLSQVSADLLDAAADLANDGRPPMNPTEYSRAVVIRDWDLFRNSPIGSAIGSRS